MFTVSSEDMVRPSLWSPVAVARSMPGRQRLETALIILVFAGLAGLAALVAPRLFVLFDEAYNANVSVNLAEKGVYASQLGGRLLSFDPDITTGPALIVPLALGIRLGGATFMTLRTTMLVLFMLWLGLAFWGARAFLGVVPALVFLVVFAFTPLILEFGPCALGDVGSMGLAIAAMGALERSRNGQQGRWLLVSGLLLGMSVLTKDIMLLLVGAIALAWAVGFLVQQRAGAGWRMLVPSVIAAVMSVGWRLVQIVMFRWIGDGETYGIWLQTVQQASRRFWVAIGFDPLSHLTPNWGGSIDYFLPLLLCLMVAVLAYLALRRGRSVRWISMSSLAQRSLAVGCLLWVTWYYLLSGPHTIHRHLLPGLVLGLLLVVMLVESLWQGGSETARSRQRLVAALLSALLIWSVLHGIGYLRLYLRASEPRLAYQQTAAAWIRQNTPQDALLSGWGWYAPWHVAFLANRGVSRIEDWGSTLRGVTDWFVLCPEILWDRQMTDRLHDFLARQGPPVVDQRLYPVYRVVWRGEK